MSNPVISFAGALKTPSQYAKPEHFFDWKYAQEVWFEMRSHEAIQAEADKYAADFDPWLALYKKDKRKALAELKTYPEAKRRNIERGYDVQLSYDQWRDDVYMSWFKGHRAGTLDRKWTFDQVLESFGKRSSCVPQHFLNECGPVPDWRDNEDKAKEQAMMREAAKK